MVHIHRLFLNSVDIRVFDTEPCHSSGWNFFFQAADVEVLSVSPLTCARRTQSEGQKDQRSGCWFVEAPKSKRKDKDGDWCVISGTRLFVDLSSGQMWSPLYVLDIQYFKLLSRNWLGSKIRNWCWIFSCETTSCPDYSEWYLAIEVEKPINFWRDLD